MDLVGDRPRSLNQKRFTNESINMVKITKFKNLCPRPKQVDNDWYCNCGKRDCDAKLFILDITKRMILGEFDNE